MTRTARRRWSREFQGEIDGIALGPQGPVLVHGYDQPAGGKWVDNVIPGKLAAYDRQSGDELWVSPCEVGYGRGFGGGLGDEEDAVVLGPSVKGHRIVRMSLTSGELLGVGEIQAFDQALVFGDMSITVMSSRVSGILTSHLFEAWSFARDGERYHAVGRSGDYLLVVYTDLNAKRQGVLRLDVESGDFIDQFLPAEYAVIHEMVCDEGIVTLFVGDRAPSRFGHNHGTGPMRLEAWRADGAEAHPLWRDGVLDESPDDMPDVSVTMDSAKLYVVSGAMLSARDGLSGRDLGEWTLPGLDERIAWGVSQGAGLVAEETRVSIFELPA